MGLPPVSGALCLAAALLVSAPIGAVAAPLGAASALPRIPSRDLSLVRPAADAVRIRRDACAWRGDCPGRRPPGDPDRDVRPFEGSLGRPCAYRPRFTPSGTRRVRVCY